ncbi:hypothetical protein LTR66_015905, partial [Elasticomyces elasticus]
ARSDVREPLPGPSQQPEQNNQYQSPYGPTDPNISPELTQALNDINNGGMSAGAGAMPAAEDVSIMSNEDEFSDEESIQLQLQQIELRKKEVDLRLKLKRLQKGRPASSRSNARISSLYTGMSAGDEPPKKPSRDSRSKSKIAESKKKTAERQEKMLKDLERRTRRRDQLTAEWVQSKDIWPARAQNQLTQLMHQYGTYTISATTNDAFEAIFRDLYTLVDQEGWYAPVHDDMLRERTRRKMGQLRSKMAKNGEILGPKDGLETWMRVPEGAEHMGNNSEDMAVLGDMQMQQESSMGVGAMQQQSQVDEEDMHMQMHAQDLSHDGLQMQHQHQHQHQPQQQQHPHPHSMSEQDIHAHLQHQHPYQSDMDATAEQMHPALQSLQTHHHANAHTQSHGYPQAMQINDQHAQAMQGAAMQAQMVQSPHLQSLPSPGLAQMRGPSLQGMAAHGMGDGLGV